MTANPVTQFDDPGLSDELKLLQGSVRQFADEKLKPVADEFFWQEKQVPQALIEEMKQLGYFGVGVPEEAGDQGFGPLGLIIMSEELSRGWMAVASIACRNPQFASLLLKVGTKEQQDKYVAGLVSGELMCAIAGTEPEAGSDAANVQTTALRDQGWYILNGTKMFCTDADRANLVFTLVRTDTKAEPKHRGVSCLVIDKKPGDAFDPPGLTGRALPVLGYHGVGTFELSFQDYRIPTTTLLGGDAGLNRGFYQLMSTYEPSRTVISARCVGMARGAYEEAVAYAFNRVQFGHAIVNFQAQRFRIAEMAVNIAAAKLLVYDVARRLERGQPCALEAGMAKLFSSESAWRCVDEALKIHGGYGYTKSRIARYWLDTRIYLIGDGTTDIMKRLISDQILGKAGIPQ